MVLPMLLLLLLALGCQIDMHSAHLCRFVLCKQLFVLRAIYTACASPVCCCLWAVAALSRCAACRHLRRMLVCALWATMAAL